MAFFLFLICMAGSLQAGVFTNIKIRNISNDATNTLIMWTNISALSQNWIVADQYVPLEFLTNHSIITGWGVQIYSHNKTNIANPVYKGTNNPGGLIGTTSSNVVLALAWLIKTNKSRPPRPIERGSFKGFTNFDWHYLSDKKTAGFTNGLDYFVAWNQGGTAWHEAVRQNKPLKAYVYFAAKFQNLYESRYQTSQLRVEEFSDPSAPFTKRFYVYTNVWSGSEPNHFTPDYENWGGGTAPVMNFAYTGDYHSPGSSARITFFADTKGAVVWYEPFSFCPEGKQFGYDITGATNLTFWIKGDVAATVGIRTGQAGDSLPEILNVDGLGVDTCSITTAWVKHFIPLKGLDLSHVTRAFKIWVWNPGLSFSFEVDDIRFER
jgi:hypothetical protein